MSELTGALTALEAKLREVINHIDHRRRDLDEAQKQFSHAQAKVLELEGELRKFELERLAVDKDIAKMQARIRGEAEHAKHELEQQHQEHH